MQVEVSPAPKKPERMPLLVTDHSGFFRETLVGKMRLLGKMVPKPWASICPMPMALASALSIRNSLCKEWKKPIFLKGGAPRA